MLPFTFIFTAVTKVLDINFLHLMTLYIEDTERKVLLILQGTVYPL